MSEYCEWSEYGPPFKCVRCDQTANNRTTRKTCRAHRPTRSIEQARPVPMPPNRDAKVEQHGPAAVEAWGIIKQAQSLVAESTRWIAAGCPLRTEAEQLAIEAICRACDKRRETENGITCGICGCAVSRKSPDEHAAKIMMATTKCVDNPPRW